MKLIHNTHGKGRVRVLRIHRTATQYEIREVTVLAMLEGDFSRAFTDADNARVVSTDTVKNVVNIVARENLAAANEPFCQAVSQRFLDTYAQVQAVTITAHETLWSRLTIDGAPHPHTFTLAANGKPFARVRATRDASALESGVDGFTFLKCTQSGWANYAMDELTTIKPTDDRIAATSMAATWRWRGVPKSYPAANALVLETMLKVFATTYSSSVQDSLYRMASAALEAVPEVEDFSLACPNKHYIPMDLSAFGLGNDNQVFLPTDEPHGQIECVVGRG